MAVYSHFGGVSAPLHKWSRGEREIISSQEKTRVSYTDTEPRRRNLHSLEAVLETGCGMEKMGRCSFIEEGLRDHLGDNGAREER